jgi:hypothetical protein
VDWAAGGYRHLLAEKERQHSTDPFTHKLQMHPRTFWLCLGFSLFTTGCIIAAPISISYPGCPVYFLLAAAATFICFGWMFLPCRCGRSPLLTAKARAHIAKHNSARTQIGLLVLTIALVLPLVGFDLWLVDFLEKQFGRTLLDCYLGWFAIALGSVTMLASALNKLPRDHTVVSEHERAEADRLTGDTQEELDKLIDFHLKVGNFSQADAYSSKLLALAEGVQPCTVEHSEVQPP